MQQFGKKGVIADTRVTERGSRELLWYLINNEAHAKVSNEGTKRQ